MHTFAQKLKTTHRTTSAKSTRPNLAHSGQSRQTNPILNLQRTIGNQATQRLLEAKLGNLTGSNFGRTSVLPLQTKTMKAEGKSGSGAEKLIDGGTTPAAQDAGTAINPDGGTITATPMAPSPAPAPPVSPPSPPPPTARPVWKSGQHIVPTFNVTETEGPRSNTDPASTDVDTPTFTGGVAADAAASMWRYQLKSVEGNGRIQFVYYTTDHYPAPTPNDDSGDLSNVTQANWKDIVKDLESHKNGVAGNWSAYRRTILHERYHWAKEWQGSVKNELVKAENDIEKEGVSLAAAADPAAAETVLAPKAKKIFDGAMAAARKIYNALGDSPGDPPYVAGSAGAVDLAARVKAHATTKKW